MFASARVVHHKTAGLRFWRNNQWRILQPAILIANRKKPRRSGQGVWRGVNEIFGMRDGWHTIPVKLLSQLRLSFGPPCSSNSSMGLSRQAVFDITFWTQALPVLGKSKSVDPQYEQRIEGHKLGFVGVLTRLGRTTPDQQWRLNGLRICDTRVSCICTNGACSAGHLQKILRKSNGSARNY